MPEFVLDHGTAEASVAFASLDTFTQAYVEAMFWTDASPDSDDCADATFAELAPAALASVIADCADFQSSDVWADFDFQTGGANEAQAGHDFWLTRNRHGAGFWDRGLPEPFGKALTDHAHAYGSASLYRGDDGLLYLA